jgi:hypothetical protein
MKKQTAGNNVFLFNVKLMMNKKIFARTTAIMNHQGHNAAVAYVGQFFRAEVRDSEMTRFQEKRLTLPE